jgi:hypothetical protein
MVSSFIVVLGIQVALVLAVFGWIPPLAVGLVLRRTLLPRPRPWLIASAIWGGISALTVAGLVVAAVLIEREYGSGYHPPSATVFEAEDYSGPTVALSVPDGMTVRMTLGPAGGDQEDKAWSFESGGNTLTVPEGAMQIHSLTFSRKDETGVEWRLGSDWNEPTPFTPGQDTPPWTGRLRAGMQVTSSPLNDKFQASLQFADEAGRPYELESPCGKPDSAQQLAIVDAQGNEVWSGRFSFG